MNDRSWKAVSVNLGCGGPRASEYRDGVVRWSEGAARTFDIVFAQETPTDDDWRELWSEYDIFESAGPPYRPRSAVIARKDLGGESFEYSTSDYHGSYVAAATVGDLVVMSVHASPNALSEQWRQQWTQPGRTLPDEYRGPLWDSDLVLETVRVHAVGRRVLACGDWNEARRWDVDHAGGTGAAFFRRLATLDLIDICCPDERDAPRTHDKLCLDHIIGSPGVADRIAVGQVVDEHEWPADHRPVEFTIG